jgi:transposase
MGIFARLFGIEETVYSDVKCPKCGNDITDKPYIDSRGYKPEGMFECSGCKVVVDYNAYDNDEGMLGRHDW